MNAPTRSLQFLQRGLMLYLPNPPQAVRRAANDCLVYQKITFHRGEEAREHGPCTITRRRCFEVYKDPAGVQDPHLIMPAGFLPRLANKLKPRGYQIRVRELDPHPRPEVYVPQWQNLAQVKFRHRQREVLEAVVKNRRTRIDCPTGYGKSFLSQCLVRLLPKARIVISTMFADVLRDHYDAVLEATPNVGIIGDGKKKRVNARVLCVSGGSLHHVQGPVDFLLIDEDHEFATDRMLEKLTFFPQARTVGLSASGADRADNMHFELEGVLGPVRVSIPYQEAVDHGCVVPIRVRWLPVPLDHDPVSGLTNSTQVMRYGIWRNEVRNQVIAQAARTFDDQTQVLIAVDTVEHAMFLKAELPEFELAYAESNLPEKKRRQYVNWELIRDDEPRMTKARRIWLKKQFEKGKLRKVICTTVWSRGVNFKQLPVLIRADGRDTAIRDTQWTGRLSRLFDGKEEGLLLDLLDNFNERFKKRQQKRAARYAKKNWKQEKPVRKRPRRSKPPEDPRQGSLFI